MRDGGLVSKVLGIRVTWMRNGAIRLDQEFYAKSILEEFGMKDAKAKHLPLSPSMNLSDENSPNLNRESHSDFRQIIGKLTYLAGGTRPDIQFSVNRLSQHLATPRKVHLEAAKHVLRYVAGTLNYGITYCPDASGSKGPMGYSDASYANAETSRLTSGYIFLLAGGPISWLSRKQPITATSSTEAEYVAAAEASKQAVWLRHFLYAIRKLHNRSPTFLRMPIERPIDLGIDNQGAIKLAENPVLHGRSKHIKLRYHAIRDYIKDGELQPQFVPTDQMLADGLTKVASPGILQRMVQTLRLNE
jgi:hypothetical protein